MLLASLVHAQKAVTIKHGSPDYKAIILAITPYANAHASHPCRVPAETMKRAGDWAFVRSSLPCIDPKNGSGGSLIALLKKGHAWTIREIAVGTTGLDDLARQWESGHKLPPGLVGPKR